MRRLAGGGRPPIVYEPIRHTLAAGGKRLRAILTLLACGAVGGDERSAVGAAVAIEALHNFTLIHDDVMDRSPLRRGRPTVHAKWNDAVAILSGDQLLQLGYRELLGPRGDGAPGRAARSGAPLGAVLSVYTRALRDVCDGQGFDLAYESRRAVTMRGYLSMIDLKTARVIAAAAEMGALAGGATPSRAKALRSYGRMLGLAFQIRDDVLDVTGDPGKFGKQIGGDIARGKKTYLLVRAMGRARGRDLALLRAVASGRGAGRVEAVRAVYERTGAVAEARRAVGRLTGKARAALGGLPSTDAKEVLLAIASGLADRTA